MIVFSLSIFIHYLNFLDLKQKDLVFLDAFVEKQYPKKTYQVLKIKTAHFSFYTISRENIKNLSSRPIVIGVLTKKITFLDSIKGFYAPNVYIKVLSKKPSISDKIKNYFLNQHENQIAKEFYGAIFFAQPISKFLRDSVTAFGIAHLVAISGFHLGIISFILAGIFFLFYNYFHKNFFPYRNKLRDFFVFSFIFVIFYLFLIGFVASFVRAFFMMVFGYFLASRSLKIISFENLAITAIALGAIFPKLLFSIGFFLSLAGVFYIFLFVKFVHVRSKILYSFWLSLFLFVAMTPLVFYFFPFMSFYQILSVPLTMIFSVFFPLGLLLHVFNLGNLLDFGLDFVFNRQLNLTISHVNNAAFFGYILASFLSIYSKKLFFIFCVFIIIVNIFLYFP